MSWSPADGRSSLLLGPTGGPPSVCNSIYFGAILLRPRDLGAYGFAVSQPLPFKGGAFSFPVYDARTPAPSRSKGSPFRDLQLLPASAFVALGESSKHFSPNSKRRESELRLCIGWVCRHAGARSSINQRTRERNSLHCPAGTQAARVTSLAARRGTYSDGRQLGFNFKDSHAALSKFWQKRFHDFNVWSQKNKIEKLNYMHLNPVKRKLASHPRNWAWSSYSHYNNGKTGLLDIDMIE